MTTLVNRIRKDHLDRNSGKEGQALFERVEEWFKSEANRGRLPQFLENI